MEKLTFGILFLALIVIDAVGQGLEDRKLKLVAGLFKAGLLFFLVGCMLFFQTLYWGIILWPDQCVLLILAYILLRYALYDVVWNIAAGHPFVFWLTGVKRSDKLHEKIITRLSKLIGLSKDFLLLWIRSFALILGSLLIKWAF